MKTNKNRVKQPIPDSIGKQTDAGEALISEITGVNSIQEFIEMKKLQNRILSKLIEKLNTDENQIKSKNK
jgi:hypothetical protein